MEPKESRFDRSAAALGLAVLGLWACAEAGADIGTDIGGGANDGKGGSGTGGGFTLPDRINPGTGGSSGVPEGQGCNDLKVNFEKLTPTVALLIDRSSSMSDAMYGNDTRWNVLKRAILDPVNGLVKQIEDEVRFGLVTYTSTAQDATCPVLGTVGFAMGNYAEIEKLYGPSTTPAVKAETPTAEGIRETIKLLEGVTEKGPKYIVLATDGEPDGCPGTCTGDCPVHQRPGYPRDPNCGHDESVATVQDGFKKGIATYVVALGNEVGADHLQALANAGVGLAPALGTQKNWLQYTCNIKPGNLKATWVETTTENAPVYRPENAEALARDLQKILGLVRGCKFQLKGAVDLNSAKLGLVFLDDVGLLFQDPNGWRMNSATELEILGDSCAKIQNEQSKDLFITFPCGVFNPE